MTLAIMATVALALPARAQFGPDLRLTGPPVVSQTARSNAWSVATDDAGNVHVVYFDARGGADVAPYYRRYDRSLGTWSAEMRLPDAAVSNTRYVAIAVDADAQVHVVWVSSIAGDHHYLYYKKRSAAGVWGSDMIVQSRSYDGWDMRDPSVATDYADDVIVLWAEGIKDGTGVAVCNILYNINGQPGNTWSGPQGLTNYSAGVDPAPGAITPTVATQPRIVANGAIAHVAWADYPAGAVRYRPVRFPIATAALGTGPLTLGLGAAQPTIAARCDEVHVAWSDPVGGAIVHRRGVMISAFTETTRFDPQVPTGLSGQSPSVAMDGLCNLQLVMVSGGAVVQSQRSKLSGGWSAPVAVSDPGAVPTDPSIAADPRGSVHVAWTDKRTVPPGVGGAWYDMGGCTAVPAPNEAQIAALAAGASARPAMTADLEAARSAAAPEERLPVIARLKGGADLGALQRSVSGLGVAERRQRVIETLRATAGRAQAGVVAELLAARQAGRAAEIRALWSVNAVAASVTPAELDRLAARDDIAELVYDPERPMLPSGEQPTAAARPPTKTAPPDALRSRAGEERGAATATPAWSVSWIGAPTVWAQGYRGACVLVAIIDTGVKLTHSDLAARIWTNAGEIPGNGIDDDGNGFIDDVHGYDTRNHDGDPTDDNGHGTEVSGSVAGDGTGGTLTGVAPEARLMAVKCLSASGGGSDASILQGIDYAVENGAQVLNLSLGTLCPSIPSRAMYRSSADAVAAAGVTMCVAAGNDRTDQRPPNLTRTPGDVPPPWISPGQPAIGATGGVTTVGATGYQSDVVAKFSSEGPVDWSQPSGYGDWRICDPGTPNVGLIKPDISAPGTDVTTTALSGGYTVDSGTSMATPHVAGLAALVLSKNYELTSVQVHQIIESSALDLGPAGKDNDFGSGRIRAPEALAGTPAPSAQPIQFVAQVIRDTIPPAYGDGRLERGETADIQVTLRNDGPYKLGNVVGTLQSSSSYVTVVDGVASFGDITPSQQASNASNPFRVTVASDAPNLTQVPLTIQLSAYGACDAVTTNVTLYDGVTGVEPGTEPLPVLALDDVAPNPAGGAVTLAFAMRAEGPVRLALYDVRGRLVRTLVNGTQPAGRQRVPWDGRDDRGARAAAGIYLARLDGAGLTAQRKFAWLGR